MRTLVISETETSSVDMPSFRFTAGQRRWAVRLWNDFAETSGNIDNIEQLKAEVQKRHFLIYSIFFNKFHVL